MSYICFTQTISELRVLDYHERHLTNSLQQMEQNIKLQQAKDFQELKQLERHRLQLEERVERANHEIEQMKRVYQQKSRQKMKIEQLYRSLKGEDIFPGSV